MTIPRQYLVCAPNLTHEDRSGKVGQRLLRLLSIQAQSSLRWVQEVCRHSGVTESEFILPDGKGRQWPLHLFYNAATSAYVFAVLARFGKPDETMGGVPREKLEELARIMISAVIRTHPASGAPQASPTWWHKLSALRFDHIFGMGAWLLWEKLSTETQLLVARILEHDADLYLEEPAPAQLYDDTQAESNAWNASGLALAYCMLKQHPHRDAWGDKAKEFMISAYATERDVTSRRLLDGKPLNQWLRGPNTFPDYTVENHGFIHPIYMAAVSEKVRTAICYRLADEPVPEAAPFNAEHVLDMLMFLNLPDGNHLYVQGTDYDPRRLDSFFQACNIVPLNPNPLRTACFLRVLESMERMARERPDRHLSGNIIFDFDFGTSWGLIENYLMRRLFGSPTEAIPNEQIEARLAGVHLNEAGKFVVHRTPRTISSFSWHAVACGSQVMGVTMPLDKDVLCFPCPGSYLGDIRESPDSQNAAIEVEDSKVATSADGFNVLTALKRCLGKVQQNCAFVSLPDGQSVYLEERVARDNLSIASAESGNLWIYDDLRWPFQTQERVFYARAGILQPAPGQVHNGNWLNISNHMGYVALGSDTFTLARGIDNYQTWRLAFLHSVSLKNPQRFHLGQTIGVFGLVSCPHQVKDDTAELARGISARGWLVKADGVLAVVVNSYILYANFSNQRVDCRTNAGRIQLEPRTCGFLQA